MGEAALAILEILRALTWSHPHAKAEQLVFRSQDELAKVWVADGGKKEDLPKVDFEKEMAIAVFAGEKPNSGYGVKIEKVAVDQDTKVLDVLFNESAPDPGKMYAQVLSYPCQVVVVKRTEGKVNFVKLTPEQMRIK